VRIDALRQAYTLAIKWTAFPLHPDLPEAGLALEDLFKGSHIDIGKVGARLKDAAAEVGLPLGERKMAYNTRLAHELAKWAEGQGRGDVFHRAVFGAYFVDGRNIGKVDELAAIAEGLGLSGEEARKVLASRSYKHEVDTDWARAKENGITAVPAFAMNRAVITGAQPYETLEKFVRTHLSPNG
jgi:predicted DsbA family dithiol-disulfide isomerase